VSSMSMASLRVLRWLALPVILFFFSFGLVVYAFVIHESAKSILKDVSALRVGVSSIGRVDALVARHKGALEEKSCHENRCFFSFEVYNTWLYRLKLEPVARFHASVVVDDGTVHSIHITLSRDTRVFPTSPSAGITDEYERVPERLVKFADPPYWFPTPVGKPYLNVALTAEANAIQREHAYSYSLTCLIKPGGGCDLPCDYLPLAWHDWQAALEQQSFGVGGFGPYYPNRERCK